MGDAAKGALWINSHASIWGGVLKAGQSWSQPLGGAGYLLVSSGEVRIEGVTLAQGDGVAITDTTTLTVDAITASELVVIDLPRVD